MPVEKATFGGGCFWGVEEAFRILEGVKKTAVGYSGGHLASPTYEQVCSGKTGHAEVVRLEFDPGQISYNQLLDVFWGCHNPTMLNRQGPDVGTQYRSVIFYHSADQERLASESKRQLVQSGKYEKEIVTEIGPAGDFYLAEDYHQQYLAKRGQSACHWTPPTD